jgi:hypothetical protein
MLTERAVAPQAIETILDHYTDIFVDESDAAYVIVVTLAEMRCLTSSSR